MRCSNKLDRVFGIGVAAFALAISMICAPSRVSAQDAPELVTDRPDQTESSSVVGPGYVQFEGGWTYSENDGGVEVRTNAIPEILLRIGLVERLELRLGFSGYVWEDVDTGEDNEGLGDTEVGTKLLLREEGGFLPGAAFLTRLSLPTGESGFSSERADPSFAFLFSHTLTDRLSFGYNMGAVWGAEEDDSGNRHTLSVFRYTATLGVGLMERLGGFVEVFGDVPLSASGGPANLFDGGFTYLIFDNFQIDVASGVGLSHEADDWFITTGATYRFPN